MEIIKKCIDIVLVYCHTFAMIAIIDTHNPDAPTPATARPNIRKFTDGETAQNKLPTSNMAIAARNTGLSGDIAKTRPKKSLRAVCFVNKTNPTMSLETTR